MAQKVSNFIQILHPMCLISLLKPGIAVTTDKRYTESYSCLWCNLSRKSNLLVLRYLVTQSVSSQNKRTLSLQKQILTEITSSLSKWFHTRHKTSATEIKWSWNYFENDQLLIIQILISKVNPTFTWILIFELNKVQQIHGLPFFNGVICSLALASSLHKTENIFRECNICLYLLKRCHSKSSQVHVHFPDLMRFYFFTPKVSDRLRCDSLGNSYEKRHNEFTLTSINPWTSIPLNLLLTIIYIFISFSHSNHKSPEN